MSEQTSGISPGWCGIHGWHGMTCCPSCTTGIPQPLPGWGRKEASGWPPMSPAEVRRIVREELQIAGLLAVSPADTTEGTG